MITINANPNKFLLILFSLSYLQLLKKTYLLNLTNNKFKIKTIKIIKLEESLITVIHN